MTMSDASSMNCQPSGSSGMVSTTVAPPTSGALPKPSIADTIRQVEGQIASYGPGPHTPQQKEELSKLTSYFHRAKLEQQKLLQMMSSNKLPDNSLGPATISPMLAIPQSAQNLSPAPMPAQATTSNGASGGEGRVLDKRRLQELVKEVDPLEQLDDDVEDVLLQIADDFIENVVSASCQIAKHRKSNTLEVKDVQLYLERSWNMWVPGFGSEEIRPFKKAAVTEAHKQRMALIRKTLKKY
ncbi:transcription initiation factor TFIID subunit 12-like [Haliotis rubra]|uniref:transcription initiation factor TFIID subunit 12-like n=1 Tax=Haliotis rubra TaxID=36100 RepID=UPI001EE54317|nr:transcription initiation factor TFIID subunit 12-like [Haliotis rubra]